MNSIFDNAYRAVTPAYKPKDDVKKIDIVSEQTLSIMTLREMAESEKNENDAYEMAKYEKDKKRENMLKNIERNNIIESQLSVAIGMLSENVKNYIFKDILSEIYINALHIDKDFVEEHFNELDQSVCDYVDNNGGFKLLENAISRTNSNLLKKIKTICEKTSNSICSRKIKEANETRDINSLNFDIGEEEKDIISTGKSEISSDEISELVKDKVLTVIKDEKARQEQEDELRSDIEKEIMDSDDVTDIETAKEAVNSILVNNIKVEEATLFSGLLRHTCNEYIIEGLTTVNGNSQYDVDTTEDDIINNAANDDEVNLKKEYDSDELTVGMRETNDTANINMEAALADTIAQYTLMETLYTLKLEDYTYDNIKNLSMKLIQPIRVNRKY